MFHRHQPTPTLFSWAVLLHSRLSTAQAYGEWFEGIQTNQTVFFPLTWMIVGAARAFSGADSALCRETWICETCWPLKEPVTQRQMEILLSIIHVCQTYHQHQPIMWDLKTVRMAKPQRRNVSPAVLKCLLHFSMLVKAVGIKLNHQ